MHDVRSGNYIITINNRKSNGLTGNYSLRYAPGGSRAILFYICLIMCVFIEIIKSSKQSSGFENRS